MNITGYISSLAAGDDTYAVPYVNGAYYIDASSSSGSKLALSTGNKTRINIYLDASRKWTKKIFILFNKSVKIRYRKREYVW